MLLLKGILDRKTTLATKIAEDFNAKGAGALRITRFTKVL
jgi:hypothetical protein